MNKKRVFVPSLELLNSVRIYRTLLLLSEVPDERIAHLIKLFINNPTRESGHPLQFTDEAMRETIMKSLSMKLPFSNR